jgi:hypothetical protein
LYSCGARTDTYKFLPTITKAGSYNIYVRYVTQPALSTAAKIRVKSTAGVQAKTISMQTGGGDWVLLGNYNLAPGTASFVEVSDASGAVNIDGVKLQMQ